MDNKQSNQNSWEETDIQWEERIQREAAKDEARKKQLEDELDDLLNHAGPSEIRNIPTEVTLTPIKTSASDEVYSPLKPEKIMPPIIPYEFPIASLSYSDLGADDIVNSLRSLADTANKFDQYLETRKLFCNLSIELNSRGLMAPAFRPSPTIPYLKKDRNYSHLLIQQDRIVIDCHWLHARKVKIYSSEPDWRGLFDLNKDFSFDKVSDFACHDIKNEYRATAIMKLTLHQQCQMRALRSVETQKLFFNLYNSIRVPGEKRLQPRLELIELAINQWCEADTRMVQWRPQYVALAKAIELMGDSSPTLLGELMGLIKGVPPLDESTVRPKIIKLRKIVHKYSTP